MVRYKYWYILFVLVIEIFIKKADKFITINLSAFLLYLQSQIKKAIL